MSDERVLPDQIVTYLENFKLTPKQRQAEIDAYWKVQAMIDSTSDTFVRRVHAQTLDFVIHDGNMKLTYCLGQVFPSAIADQKAARKKLRPFALFVAIERILAGATHTSNFGDSHRWPLHTSGHYSLSRKLPRNGSLAELALPADLSGAYYQFGVHTFRVGLVVEEIMRMIEKRYGIDFAMLEKQRKTSTK
ncbi:hypothetical protein [Mesorhizobium sp. NZP2298]|uniref:hypothetical protein n=1 Tax=Mesorhizobium sp. NZP2298 TaxID=2483403 RepID=UPI001556A6BF|nr:hypothetical protein [Mesorhizobium sp. NZP2298]QKC97159.1 hypothetical protein EB231_22600 [Mesorhizobium sp. NZP2298]